MSPRLICHIWSSDWFVFTVGEKRGWYAGSTHCTLSPFNFENHSTWQAWFAQFLILGRISSSLIYISKQVKTSTHKRLKLLRFFLPHCLRKTGHDFESRIASWRCVVTMRGARVARPSIHPSLPLRTTRLSLITCSTLLCLPGTAFVLLVLQLHQFFVIHRLYLAPPPFLRPSILCDYT